MRGKAKSHPPSGEEPQRPPRRRRPLAIVTLVVGASLIVLALVGLVGGAALVRRYEDAVSRDQLLAPDARVDHAKVTGPLNFLLLGSDARSNNPDMGQRSDTVIVLHVAADLRQAYLISVPRDLRVNIPKYPALNFPGQVDKINAAFQYGRGGRGGIQLLSQTLTELMGIHFDGAAVINFTGLQRAVGVLGGMTLCVDVRTVSIHTHAVFNPGCQHMTPAQVLDYLRQRETLPNGDFDRQRHQQQFLRALFEQMLSRGILTNPLKIDGLLRTLAGSVTIDSGAALSDLVFALRNLRPANVTGVGLPCDASVIDETWYAVALPAANTLFAAVRNDTVAQWAKKNPNWINKI